MGDADILLKLGRARTHIDEFRKKTAEIRNGYCTVKPEEDSVRRTSVFRISIVPKAPDELRLVAGDALFNMRAAPDYIVWQAILSNPGQTPTRSNQFPIAQDSQTFRKLAPKQLGGVFDAVRAIVERFQPYKPDNEPLRTLSRLHNPDKHQSLNLAAVVADSSRLWSNGASGPFGLLSDIPLCDGAIFGNIGVPWDLPEEFASVLHRSRGFSIEGECTQFVGFADLFDPDEEEDGFEAADAVLERILNYIEHKVLPAVRPHLTAACVRR